MTKRSERDISVTVLECNNFQKGKRKEQDHEHRNNDEAQRCST